MNWIGLVSSDGKTEWNARFCIGSNEAETLEDGKVYSYEQLNEIGGEYQISSSFTGENLLKNNIPKLTMKTYKGCYGLKESKKWRCVKHA